VRPTSCHLPRAKNPVDNHSAHTLAINGRGRKLKM
jgi:hypothetical protein